MNQRLRDQHRLLNSSDLLGICDRLGVRVTEFIRDGHYRIHGECDVDYWPATSRAWPVGTNHKARRITPAEAVEWATKGIQL